MNDIPVGDIMLRYARPKLDEFRFRSKATAMIHVGTGMERVVAELAAVGVYERHRVTGWWSLVVKFDDGTSVHVTVSSEPAFGESVRWQCAWQRLAANDYLLASAHSLPDFLDAMASAS